MSSTPSVAVPVAAPAPAGRITLPDPSTAHLLSPKWITARARAAADERGRTLRFVLLSVFGIGFWSFIFVMLYRLLGYFKGALEIGPFLAGKLLGLILAGFFSILLLSNIITALSSFFLARDLDLLASAPVDWFKLYCAKLIETLLHSSWMVVLLAVPMFAAYGIAYGGGPLYPLIVLATFLPFLIIPTVIGSAITLLLVTVFPARRARDILSVIAVLAAGAIVIIFRLVRPGPDDSTHSGHGRGQGLLSSSGADRRRTVPWQQRRIQPRWWLRRRRGTISCPPWQRA